jgi:hypothetical protein
MMTRNVSREKKLIRAPGELIQKLKEAASRQGKTLYSYMTEVLEQAVKAYELGLSLDDVIGDYEILGVYKEAGVTSVPRDFLEFLIKRFSSGDIEVLQRLWYHAGRWCGLYLKGRFSDPVNSLARMLRAGQFDLNEVDVRRKLGFVEFRCVSTLLSQERTLLVCSFIEGAMNSLGYGTLENECFKGIIRLRFSSSANP